jgi:emfourin
MRVTLATHGGQAAAINLRRPPRVVDADSLPKEGAGELARLVAAARAAQPDKEAMPGRARDAMRYTITVEDDGQPVVLSQSDTTMSPAFAALVSWLEEHSVGK